jgi:membrane-associated phospholipid phosphatase
VHFIQAYELNWISAIQGDGGLARVMMWLSYLGWEALGFMLPFTYFVLSRAAGIRMYLLVSVADSLIGPLKLAFHSPRPCWVDPRIRGLSGWGSYGMPSGHALNAGVAWPLVGRAVGETWAWSLALLMVLLVSVSRVYLGVHFISDVVGAWITAAALISCFDWLERRSSVWLDSMATGWRLGLALWVTLALLTVGMSVQEVAGALLNPLPWPEQAGNPRDLNGLFHASGEFVGVACGGIMAGRWARFETSGAWWRRGVALGYALAGLWLLRNLDHLVPLPRTEGNRLGWELLRGAVPAWWTLFVAPWILLKTGILPDNARESARSVPGQQEQESADGGGTLND